MTVEELIRNLLSQIEMTTESKKSPVLLETPDGSLLEIEKVYFSYAGGGALRIKGLGYDDEYDPEAE